MTPRRGISIATIVLVLLSWTNSSSALRVTTPKDCISIETDNYYGFYTIINTQDPSKDRMAPLPPVITKKCLQFTKEGGK